MLAVYDAYVLAGSNDFGSPKQEGGLFFQGFLKPSLSSTVFAIKWLADRRCLLCVEFEVWCPLVR